MTTKTTPRNFDGFEITHIYSDGDVCSDGTPKSAALDRLESAIEAAIRAAFPGAEVEVERRHRTSGASDTHVSAPSDRWIEEEDVKTGAHEAAGAAWVMWSESLTDADMEER